MVTSQQEEEENGENKPPLLFSTHCDGRGLLPLLNKEKIINSKEIKELYKIDQGQPFATGLFAEVKRCQRIFDGTYFAAKFCPRKRPTHHHHTHHHNHHNNPPGKEEEENIENIHEIALLSNLSHDYIISFIDAFILKHSVVTVMELAPGGDLQTVIDADLVLLEKDASRYLFQLLQALTYLHERFIAHLDIKPQNLLLMGPFPTCSIKLCDFEISRVILPGKEIKEILGTPDYVAPEILLYDPLSTSADMWSVGILCYVLLTGFSPFGGDTDQETFRNIVHSPIDFPDELFEDVSKEAVDFVEKCVVKKPGARPTSSQMEGHEWIRSFRGDNSVNLSSVVVAPSCERQETNAAEKRHFHHVKNVAHKKRSLRKTMPTGLYYYYNSSSPSNPAPLPFSSPPSSSINHSKSTYDLTSNKAIMVLEGRTKSREALVEKMMASSASSTGIGASNWRLRKKKNLSKSREQLWESKIKLSRSCEKINGSSRWASVASFPSLTGDNNNYNGSQESVAESVASTNSGVLMSPPVVDGSENGGESPVTPLFDLTSPVTNLPEGGKKLFLLNKTDDYPSLAVFDDDDENSEQPSTSSGSKEEQEKKSVAELIQTFGGTRKKFLKNNLPGPFFEPILEDQHSIENNIVEGKNLKESESGNYSMSSSGSSNASATRVVGAAAPSTVRPQPQQTVVVQAPVGLKGILKKSPTTTFQDPKTRRGSIPGVSRLHDTHTISSLAKEATKKCPTKSDNTKRSSVVQETVEKKKLPTRTPREMPSFILLCSGSGEDSKKSGEKKRPLLGNKGNTKTPPPRRPSTTPINNNSNSQSTTFSSRAKSSSSQNKSTVAVIASQRAQQSALRRDGQKTAPKNTNSSRISIREQIMQNRTKNSNTKGGRGDVSVTLHFKQRGNGKDAAGGVVPETVATLAEKPTLEEKSVEKIIETVPETPQSLEPPPKSINTPTPTETADTPPKNKKPPSNNNPLGDSLDSLNTKRQVKTSPFPWNTLCTGSVGRALERFEGGSNSGKKGVIKLRRGSVPYF